MYCFTDYLNIMFNFRFCTPAGQCPIMDPDWESAEGVPIDAIIFGGRRPKGKNILKNCFNLNSGLFVRL